MPRPITKKQAVTGDRPSTSNTTNPASSFTPKKKKKNEPLQLQATEDNLSTLRQTQKAWSQSKADDRISNMGSGVGGMGIGTSRTKNTDTYQPTKSQQVALQRQIQHVMEKREQDFQKKYNDVGANMATMDAALKTLEKDKTELGKAEYEWVKKNQYNYWTNDQLKRGIQAAERSVAGADKKLRGTSKDTVDSLVKNFDSASAQKKKSSADLAAMRTVLNDRATQEEIEGLPTRIRTDLLENAGRWQFETSRKGKNNASGMAYNKESEQKLNTLKIRLKHQGYDEEKIQYLLDYSKRLYNNEVMLQQAQELQNAGTGTKIAASLASVPIQAAGGVAGTVDAVAQRVTGGRLNPFTGMSEGLDYNSAGQMLGNTASGIRSAVSANMSQPEAFFYNTAMSIADFLSVSALGGPGAQIILGASAAQNALQEAHQRGATDDQALAVALAAGVFESLFENVSLEKLKAFQTSAKGARLTTGEILGMIGKQSFTEGSEEAATTMANTLTDLLLMADKSQISQAKQAYMAQGMSEADATRAAWKDAAKQTMLDALGGAISGGVIGGVTGAGAKLRYHIGDAFAGRSTQAMINVADDVQAGMLFPKSSQTYKQAASILKDLAAGTPVEQISKTKTGKLQNLLQQDQAIGNFASANRSGVGHFEIQVNEMTGQEEPTFVMGPMTEAFRSEGLSSEDALARADVLQDLIDGEYVSNKQLKNTLKVFSPETKAVFEQMTGTPVPEGTDMQKTLEFYRNAAQNFGDKQAAEAWAQEQAEDDQAKAAAQAAEVMEEIDAEADALVAEEAAQVAEEMTIPVASEEQAPAETTVQPEQPQNPPAETREEFEARYAQRQAARGIVPTKEQIEKAWRRHTDTDGILLTNGEYVGRDEFYKETRENFSTDPEDPIDLTDEQLEDMYLMAREMSRTTPADPAIWNRTAEQSTVEEASVEETQEEDKPAATVLSVSEEAAEPSEPSEPVAAETEQAPAPVVEEKVQETKKKSAPAKKTTAKKTVIPTKAETQTTKTVTKVTEEKGTIPTKAETEEAKAELKAAISMPIEGKNIDALERGVRTGELTMDAVTLAKTTQGRGSGFTMEQRETIARELIENAMTEEDFDRGASKSGKPTAIQISVPYDGKLTIANDPATIAKTLDRLGVKANQRAAIGKNLAAYLKKQGKTTTPTVLRAKDGKAYVSNGGATLIPVSRAAVERLTAEKTSGEDSGYGARMYDITPAADDVLNATYDLITEPPTAYKQGRQTNLVYKIDGTEVMVPSSVMSYFDGALLYGAKFGSRAYAIKAVNPDGSLRGYVTAAFREHFPKERELPKTKSFSQTMMRQLATAPKKSGPDNTEKKSSASSPVGSIGGLKSSGGKISWSMETTANLMKRLLKPLGIKDVVFDSTRTGDTNACVIDKTIYLNENRLTNAGLIYWAVGHELTHPSTDSDPEFAKKVVDTISSMAQDGSLNGLFDKEILDEFKDPAAAIANRAETYTNLYQQNGYSPAEVKRLTSEDEMRVEVAGDWMGYLFSEQAALEQLAGIQPDFLTRAIRVVEHLRGTKVTGMLKNAKAYIDTMKMLDGLAADMRTALMQSAEASGPMADPEVKYSAHKGPAWKNVQYGFKLMDVDEEGKPHAMFIDAGKPYELGALYDADSPDLTALTKLEKGYVYEVDEDGNVDQSTRRPVAWKRRVSKAGKKSTTLEPLPTPAMIRESGKQGKRWMAVVEANDGKGHDGKGTAVYNVGIDGGGKSSKYSIRPGIHAVDIPSMRHIGSKSAGSSKIDTRRPNQRWFLIEYPVDQDYNQEAYANPDKDIKDHIPTNGWYSYQTNSGAEAKQHWFITGGMKIVGPVSEADVRKYAKDRGFAEDLPWKNGKTYDDSNAIDLDEYIRTTDAQPTPSKQEMRQRIEAERNMGSVDESSNVRYSASEPNLPARIRRDESEKANAFRRVFTGEVTSDEYIELSDREKARIGSALKSGDGRVDADGQGGYVDLRSYRYFFDRTRNNGVMVTDTRSHRELFPAQQAVEEDYDEREARERRELQRAIESYEALWDSEEYRGEFDNASLVREEHRRDDQLDEEQTQSFSGRDLRSSEANPQEESRPGAEELNTAEAATSENEDEAASSNEASEVAGFDVYNHRAVVSEDTLDRWMQDYAASNPDYAQAYMAYMSPNDYLNLTTSNPFSRSRINQEAEGLGVDQVVEASRQQPIQLRIDSKTGEVLGHEGRHRMVALRRAGVTRVPVMLFDSENKYSKTPIDSMTLRGQFNRTADATVTDVQPFSRGNEETIREKFVNQTSMERVGERYGTPQVRFSALDPVTGFYNLSERVLADVKQDKLGAASVVNMLRGKGVKAEEIKWLGIEDFLKGKKSVTKQELLDWIAANDLVLEEVTLSQNGTRPLIDDATGEVYESYEDAYSALYDRLLDEGYDEETIENNLKFDDDFGFYWYSMRDGEEFDLAGYAFDTPDDETHWSQYTTPGGTNYREILFRLPRSDYSNRASEAHWGDEAPGVLAHARVQGFTDNQGRPVLFVEEIQSDWHNAANEKLPSGERVGYQSASEATDPRIQRFVEVENAFYNSYDNERRKELDQERRAILAEFFPSNAKLYDELMEELESGEASKVIRSIDEKSGHDPRFPDYAQNVFTSHTRPDTQRYLIEDGLIDENEAKVMADWHARMDTWRRFDRRDRAQLRSEYEASSDRPPEAPFAQTYTYFVLKRLLREAAENGYAGVAWTTADMQSDRWSDEYAEGYRIEYDQDIPKFLNKFGKKFGAKVSTTELDSDGETITVPFIPVTNEMRKAILENGMPKFSARGENPAFDAYMDKLMAEQRKRYLQANPPTERRSQTNSTNPALTEEELEIAQLGPEQRTHVEVKDPAMAQMASMRLDADYDGEKERLFGTYNKWDAADLATAESIIKQEIEKARETDDFSEVRRLIRMHDHQMSDWGLAGHTARNFGHSFAGIVTDATDTLDKAAEHEPVNQGKRNKARKVTEGVSQASKDALNQVRREIEQASNEAPGSRPGNRRGDTDANGRPVIPDKATAERNKQNRGKKNEDEGEGEGNQGRNMINEPFTFEYSRVVGEAVAKSIQARMNSQKQSKTFLQQLQSEIMRFASERMPAKKNQSKPTTAVELLKSYVDNRKFFDEAWQSAREELQRQYGDELPGAVQSFMRGWYGLSDGALTSKIMRAAIVNAAMDSNETRQIIQKQVAIGAQDIGARVADELIRQTGAKGELADMIHVAADFYVDEVVSKGDQAKIRDRLIQHALRDIGKAIDAKTGPKSMSKLGATSAASKAVVRDGVINTLINKYDVSQADAENVANVVGKRFDELLRAGMQKRLESLFKEKKRPDKTKQQSFLDRVLELTNLGAMDSKDYHDAAVNKLLDGYTTRRGTTVDEVLKKVYDYADRLDRIPEGDVAGLKDIITKLNAERWTGGMIKGNEIHRTLRNAINTVASQPGGERFLRQLAAAQIRGIANDNSKITATEAIGSIRYLSMLSKLTTTMRNLVGNTTFDLTETLSNNFATPLDMLLSTVTGRRTTDWDRSYASAAKRRGMADAARRAYIEVALDAPIEDGQNRWEMKDGRTFKMAKPAKPNALRSTGNLAERLLSSMEKWQRYLLTVSDEFYKGGIRDERQRGIDRLKARGLLEQDALQNEAQQVALERTFQNRDRMASALDSIRGALDTVAGVKDYKGNRIGLGTALMPFARVPANIAGQVLNYSPAGLIKAIGEVAAVVKAGKKATAEQQAKAVRDFGRGVNGTALITLFALAALKGALKRAGSGDDDEDALLRDMGQTGVQLNLDSLQRILKNGDPTWQKDDTLIALGGIEPLNGPMAFGALLADSIDEESAWWAKIGNANWQTAMQAMADLPAMSSINNIINAYKYSDEKYDAETNPNGGPLKQAADAAASGFGDFAASFIPNVLGGIAAGVDEGKTRTTRTSDKRGLEAIPEEMLNQAKLKIPGLRSTLPQALDSFGNPRQTTANNTQNWLNSNVLPLAINSFQPNPVSQELIRLREDGAKITMPSRTPIKSVDTADGQKKLTESERREYQQTMGAAAFKAMSDAIDSPEYDRMPDETKAEVWSGIKSYATAKGKQDVGGKSQDPDWYDNYPGSTADKAIANAWWKTARTNAGLDSSPTQAEVIDAITKAGLSSGMTQTLINGHLSEAGIEKYNGAKAIGLNPSTYINILEATSQDQMPADKKPDGKSISGSRKNKVVAYLNNLVQQGQITQEQASFIIHNVYGWK